MSGPLLLNAPVAAGLERCPYEVWDQRYEKRLKQQKSDPYGNVHATVENVEENLN